MAKKIPQEPVLRELEAACVRLARGAGEILQRYKSGSIRVEFKGKGRDDPVTEADRKVEEYLREEISRQFPEHGVVAEESADATTSKNADFIWAVDPIDGTANFAAGLPFSAVSIALLYLGVPVASSILTLPFYTEEGVYHARAGGGAFAGETPIRVNSNAVPEPSALAGIPSSYGRVFYFRPERGRGLGQVRILGSIACEMVLVAKGVFQYAVFTGSRVWDVAAGVLLAQEAGGEVLEWRKGGWRPFQEFLPGSEKSGESPCHTLRRWSVPLLVGNKDILAYLASRTKLRRRLLGSILRKVRPFQARAKRGHA